MVNFLNGTKAYEIGHKYKPKIFQEIEDIKDFITPILLGEATPMAIVEQFKNAMLYFKASEDTDNYYILYMVYHPFDYSDSFIPIIKKADSHRHDTECVLVKADKKGKGFQIATVCHSCLIFAKTPYPTVFISAGSHSIHPIDQVSIEDKKKLVLYQNLPLDNMGEYTDVEIDNLTKEFNKTGVNFPTQMSDNILRLQSINERNDFKHEVGDLWNNPDRVFKSAERFGKL